MLAAGVATSGPEVTLEGDCSEGASGAWAGTAAWAVDSAGVSSTDFERVRRLTTSTPCESFGSDKQILLVGLEKKKSDRFKKYDPIGTTVVLLP